MLTKCSFTVSSERKLLPIRSGRVTLNVAGCIQVVSFSFFLHGLVWLHETSLYQHFPFHRKSRVICQQLCWARTPKSARSSCMSCWNTRLWGNATAQHSPGTSPAAISLASCSPWCENIPGGVLAMLALEHSLWCCHNGSLDCADTVVVRLGQEAEFLFWQSSYNATVLFHAVLKN